MYDDHVFVCCVNWSGRYVDVLKTKRRKIEKARERERRVKVKKREREKETEKERDKENYINMKNVKYI